MVLFCVKNGIGWTFGWTFGWTDFDLQKRKVLIGWTFGWTLLTLLKVLCGGTLPKKQRKNGFFLVFKGRKSKKKTVFRGRNSQESAYFQGFARNNVKFGCTFGLIKAQTDYYLNRLDIL